jgi:hypothetical protein
MIAAVTLPVGRSVAAPQASGASASSVYLSGNSQQAGHSRPPEDEPFATREIQERQLKRLREEHQKQVFTDTAELLKLAHALKMEVDKSEVPSPDALKEVDEISKLAKRVSERIKTQ